VLLVCQHGRWFGLFHQGRGDELPDNRVTCTRGQGSGLVPKTLPDAPQAQSEGGNLAWRAAA